MRIRRILFFCLNWWNTVSLLQRFLLTLGYDFCLFWGMLVVSLSLFLSISLSLSLSLSLSIYLFLSLSISHSVYIFLPSYCVSMDVFVLVNFRWIEICKSSSITVATWSIHREIRDYYSQNLSIYIEYIIIQWLKLFLRCYYLQNTKNHDASHIINPPIF